MEKKEPPNTPSNDDDISGSFKQLYNILKKLRSPNGCPWDREQTPESFYKNLIEESYEYIDAYLKKDISECSEELGDMFLVVTMLTIMHEERDDFSLVKVLDDVSEKLVRRHPHVFSEEKSTYEVVNGDEVIVLWDSIKQNVEGKKSQDIFKTIPAASPNLLQAVEIQKKARKVGFDWDSRTDVFKKVQEELEELAREVDGETHFDISEPANKDRIIDEFGDTLFSMINYARFLGIDPDEALYRANRKFKNRFSSMQQLLSDDGKDILEETLPLTELDNYWEKAKVLQKNKRLY
ncbi:MAG: nucleoside triphosphate pyrophosphohydrolase [Spirochaetia bacterium]|nr:nucleoside triphosphate pyrophosphohydrolase [Spirochaetia bacterium]